MSMYTLIDRIGTGGMGDVFEAVRILPNGDHGRVACKSIRAELCRAPRYTELFFREAQLNLEISHGHPGLVSVFDCVEDTSGNSHLIMELVEGCSLYEIRSWFGRPSWDVLRLVAVELLHVLAYIHESEIVHRDVSPCNVLVSRTGQLKLSDLGLAKVVNAVNSEPRRFRGKWPYAAPEAVRGHVVDTRADLFSFAALMYELVTGMPIYGDAGGLDDVIDVLKEWHGPGANSDALAHVPADLRGLILGLAHERPDDRRPQTAREAMGVIGAFDRERARAQLADMASAIHARQEAGRERHPERMLDIKQHIDVYADTIEQRSANSADSAENADNDDVEARTPTRSAGYNLKRSRPRGLVMAALVLLGWMGYERYAVDTPGHAKSANAEIAASGSTVEADGAGQINPPEADRQRIQQTQSRIHPQTQSRIHPQLAPMPERDAVPSPPETSSLALTAEQTRTPQLTALPPAPKYTPPTHAPPPQQQPPSSGAQPAPSTDDDAYVTYELRGSTVFACYFGELCVWERDHDPAPVGPPPRRPGDPSAGLGGTSRHQPGP